MHIGEVLYVYIYICRPDKELSCNGGVAASRRMMECKPDTVFYEITGSLYKLCPVRICFNDFSCFHDFVAQTLNIKCFLPDVLSCDFRSLEASFFEHSTGGRVAD